MSAWGFTGAETWGDEAGIGRQGENTLKTIEELQEELKKVLKKRRYQHTIGVRYTAQSMAMRFGLDIEQAGYAGVLHDCAKYLSDSQMLLECQKNQIRCSEMEKRKPSLLHAKLGAFYAKKIYGIIEEEVLSAIRWHTTGKPGMSELEKVVYIADYIEPGRRILPHMEEIRKMAFINLDQTMYLILRNTLDYLGEMDSERMDPYTIHAYEFYKELVQK